MLSILLFAEVVSGQIVSGVVLDSATQEPMVYVHIGVLRMGVSRVSRMYWPKTKYDLAEDYF
ncbi:MAG: hypothetical protein WBA23_08950 [Tunicatimonas sp.]|uniref:hypothetical protein n=1 Tax=Tunicatimonas sp. TaxID=1940096 RepID=UPI003C71E2A9